MKRLLSLLLVLVTVVTVFAGCQAPAVTQGPGKTQQSTAGEKNTDGWGRPWVDGVIPEGLHFGGIAAKKAEKSINSANAY